MTKPEPQPPKKTEVHCTDCCPTHVRDKSGCQCGQMKDGIVTVFPDGHPKWICRKCHEKYLKLKN